MFDSSKCPICGVDSPHHHTSEAVTEFYKRNDYRTVPIEPTEEMWGGLARAIMMWIDLSGSGQKLPRDLLNHLRRSGVEVPPWLKSEAEMKALDHSMSKGSRCVLIYKAMLMNAPRGLQNESEGL